MKRTPMSKHLATAARKNFLLTGKATRGNDGQPNLVLCDTADFDIDPIPSIADTNTLNL